MPAFGLKIEVKDVADRTVVSCVRVLDAPAIDELPRIPIAVAGVGALAMVSGSRLTATYTLVELDDEQAEHWRSWWSLAFTE